jgi:hypothetical protein
MSLNDITQFLVLRRNKELLNCRAIPAFSRRIKKKLIDAANEKKAQLYGCAQIWPTVFDGEVHVRRKAHDAS